MIRRFNVTGACDPQCHYMVDIQDKLEEIKTLIDSGAYFTINRARQYGKTTTLNALAEYLKKDYVVISLDFQILSNEDFADERAFANAFIDILLEAIEENDHIDAIIPRQALDKIKQEAMDGKVTGLRVLFAHLRDVCAISKRPVVLIIDEVDSATNNQIFLDFLAQLRAAYLARTAKKKPAFQSVVLAGVYDVKNIKRKLRSDEEHRMNSPWNIAKDFLVNMSFSKDGIEGMLREYENDHNVGMDTDLIAGLIYDYTSGYPFLVSRLCELMDARVAGSEAFPDKKLAWTKEGFLEAEKILTHENNTLFESLTGKLAEYPELKKLLAAILFEGKSVSYVSNNSCIEIAAMFGFVKNEHNTVAVANRIFETVLYNQLLSEEEVDSLVYASALADKNQFIECGRLDMKLVLEKFVEAFTYLYSDEDEHFIEEVGRKYFMLFLKPIINGTGNCYVEARTREMKRTDLIVDYRGEQFVVELKIGRGPKYIADGERQIDEYLEYYNLKKGYMLIFSFNKNKKVGVTEKVYGSRILVEAIV